MNEPLLEVRVEPGADGRLRILAPRVGWWRSHPRPGAVVGGGGAVGVLEHLNRRYRLVLPEDVAGRVASALPKDRRVAVEFGAELFEIAPLEAGDPDAAAAASPAVRGSAGLSPGMHAVVAPTDGVFYRAPAPGAPPFVEVGSRIEAGHAVGLVEVMKTFNQIVFTGPGLPHEAEVVEIRAKDLEEVRAGQVLVVVR